MRGKASVQSYCTDYVFSAPLIGIESFVDEDPYSYYSPAARLSLIDLSFQELLIIYHEPNGARQNNE